MRVYVLRVIMCMQEASCKQAISEYTDQYSEPNDVTESVEEHHTCEEYKSKIWDNAFKNLEAMRLMKVTFETAKELNTDDVCSDTTRVLLNFFKVMATSQNAHYSVGMFNKMVAFITREADTTSNNFKETTEVFGRMVNNPEIRDLVKHSIVRTVDLLKSPENRDRLFKAVKAFESLVQPSGNEQLVKQTFMGLANGTKNTVGSFLRNF